MRVLKRYANRKTYDPKESRYVTYKEIAGMLKQGITVQVLDHKNGEDVTNFTLKNVLHNVNIETDKLKDLIVLSK
jgi:polyhydroxyalkanoate synthesis repressor PhaR